MKNIKLTLNDNEYVAAQTYDATLPLIVGKTNSKNIYHMSANYIIRFLDLVNVDGVPTTETNYIEQLDYIPNIFLFRLPNHI